MNYMDKPLTMFLGGALIMSIVALVLVSGRGGVLGADATQVAATFASSTAQTVATTATIISATSTGCTARSISTTGKGLMLTFDDSKTPTGTFGTWQAASTSVLYDAGQWGCGIIRAISQDAASSATVNIFR